MHKKTSALSKLAPRRRRAQDTFVSGYNPDEMDMKNPRRERLG